MVVAEPTEPIVKEFTSLFGSKAKPANSIRTYLITPLLSLSSVPPNFPNVLSTATLLKPSNCTSEPWLLTALPQSTNPPQSPRSLDPAALFEVITTGFFGVPLTSIIPPRSTEIIAYSLGVAVKSAAPRITVPAGITSFPPDFTTQVLVNKYTLEASNVTVVLIDLIPDASFKVVASVVEE